MAQSQEWGHGCICIHAVDEIQNTGIDTDEHVSTRTAHTATMPGAFRAQAHVPVAALFPPFSELRLFVTQDLGI